MPAGIPERRSKPPLPWKLALPVSVAASYGPFLVAAVLALGYAQSSNVRSGMWQVLPCAPAFIPTHLLHRQLDLSLPGKDDWWVMAHACVCSAVMVGVQAWALRQVRWLGFLLLTGSVVWSTISALGMWAGLAA